MDLNVGKVDCSLWIITVDTSSADSKSDALSVAALESRDADQSATMQTSPTTWEHFPQVGKDAPKIEWAFKKENIYLFRGWKMYPFTK